MTKLEQLKLDYARIKKDLEFYQNHERETHDLAIKSEKKLEMIEKEIKQIEESESDKKLKESILFIKDFCAEKTCINCPFYTGKQSVYERCGLMNTNPTQWQI